MSSVNKVRVNLPAIKANLHTMRGKAPEARVFAVVKANAYGLGAVPIARYLEKDADAFCVALPEEARELVEGGIQKPILSLGYLDEPWIDYYLDHEIRSACFTMDLAEKLNERAKVRGKKAYIHLALDTGHSRIGFLWNDPEVLEKIQRIADLPYLEIRGIFSHFARADEEDDRFSREQFRRFIQVMDALEAQGISLGLRHIANDAAVFRSPEYALDAIRLGICLYGEYPSAYIKAAYPDQLARVFSETSRVSYIKTIEKGVPVGYGSTWRAERKTRLATVQLGYADGYPRALSNKAQLIIHGRLCPLVGRVCMDQLMADVSAIDDPNALEQGQEARVKIGDSVLVLGEDPESGQAIEPMDLAEEAGTINYEIMTGISPRVGREYIE